MSRTASFLTPGNIVAPNPRALRLTPENLRRHVFIAGGSGHGKTKLIELLCRQLIGLGFGFTYIDPHGDGAEAVLQYLAVNNADPNRVHYHVFTPHHCSSVDPFADAPPADSHQYEYWLEARVDMVLKMLVRGIALENQEIMKRMKRWLRRILFAVGLDVNGKHLGMADALLLADPQREEWGAVFTKVANRLPPRYRADFVKLEAVKSGQQQEKWVESTINCLDDFLSKMMENVLGQHAPTLSQKDVILNSGFQIVNLRETDALSRERGNLIGGLIASSLVSTARRLAGELPEESRVPHFLIIDEAENFIGEDLRMGFAELRKFKMSLCLAVQDLSCLKKGDLDLINRVVSQCGLQMTFQQQSPDDCEFLAKVFGYGSLDLTPLMTDVVLPDGYEWVTNVSVQSSHTEGTSTSHSTAVTKSHSHSQQQHTATSIQESISNALSESNSRGHSDSRSESESHGKSNSNSTSRTIGETKNETHSDSKSKSQQQSQGESRDQGLIEGLIDGHERQSESKLRGSSETHGHSRSEGKSKSETKGETFGTNSSQGLTHGHTDNFSQSRGSVRTIGDSRGSSEGKSEGKTVGESEGHTEGSGTSEGRTIGETVQKIPLAKHKIFSRRTGQLIVSVQDQLSAIMNAMASLRDRFVLVRCKDLGSPFVLQVHNVAEPYTARGLVRSPGWKAEELRQFLENVRAAHPYSFVPGNNSEQQRVKRFLDSDSATPSEKSDGLQRPKVISPKIVTDENSFND